MAHGSAKGRKHWNGAGNLTHLRTRLRTGVVLTSFLAKRLMETRMP